MANTAGAGTGQFSATVGQRNLGNERPTMKYSNLRILALVLCTASSVLLSSCSKQAQTGEAPPPTVEVFDVVQTNVPVYREWVGSLAGDVDATISAQVSGYLLHQDYIEGHNVHKGELLFQIDDRTYQATLAQAQAKLGKTEMDVQRYTPLAKTQAISQQELDDAIQANLAAEAAVDDAQLNVQFCRITSPIDGIAGLAQGQIGDLVGPGSGPLTTVTKVDPIKAYFSVDQDLFTQVQQKSLAGGISLRSTNGAYQGPQLELILLSGTPYPLKGRVKFANNQVDVRTGTVRVVGEFPNPQLILIPGMFVTVRALVATQTNALLVPQRAVTDMQGTDLIAIVGPDNKVSIRPVKTGVRYGSDWAVNGDLKAGDRIVAEGMQKVRDGSLVNPIPFGSSTNSSEAPSQ
jgi:RND family efflux transporter MFP subunit